MGSIPGMKLELMYGGENLATAAWNVCDLGKRAPTVSNAHSHYS